MRNTKLNIYIQCTILSSMIKLYEYVFVRYFCCTFIYVLTLMGIFLFSLGFGWQKAIILYIIPHQTGDTKCLYMYIPTRNTYNKRASHSRKIDLNALATCCRYIFILEMSVYYTIALYAFSL